MIDLDIMTEADLLKFIATIHNTRFVSTEKLSKAVIEPRVLAKVSAVTATLHGVFPVLLDDRGSTLSVATADPDNDAAMHEVRLAAGVRDVRAIVARPAAVRAAIAYHYRGDSSAFNALLRPLNSFDDILYTANQNPFERSPPHHTQSATATPQPAVAPAVRAPSAVPVNVPLPPPAPTPTPAATVAAAPAVAAKTPSAPPRGAVPAALGTPTPPPPAPPPAERRPSVAPAPASAPLPPTASHQYVETLNVLVSLLENARAGPARALLDGRAPRAEGLRAHRPAARQRRRVRRRRVPPRPRQDGRRTTSRRSTSRSTRGTASPRQRACDLPAHLMESVGLPPEIIVRDRRHVRALRRQRLPGRPGRQGDPARRAHPRGGGHVRRSDPEPAQPLPQGARGRPRRATSLAQYRGTIFDPNIVDLFRQVDDRRRHAREAARRSPPGAHRRSRSRGDDGARAPAHRAGLRGLHRAHGRAGAPRARRRARSTSVVSEIDLEEPDAGLTLRSEALKSGLGRDITWVILTAKTDRQTAQRAFEMGVDDFVSKPASTDIFAAKLRQLIDRRIFPGGRSRRRRIARRDGPPRHGADPLARPEDLRAQDPGELGLGRDPFRGRADRARPLGRRAGRGRVLQDAHPPARATSGSIQTSSPRRAASRPRPRRCSSRGCAASMKEQSPSLVVLETSRLRLLQPDVELAPALLAYVARNREHLSPWEPTRADDFYTETFWRDRILAESRRLRRGARAPPRGHAARRPRRRGRRRHQLQPVRARRVPGHDARLLPRPSLRGPGRDVRSAPGCDRLHVRRPRASTA